MDWIRMANWLDIFLIFHYLVFSCTPMQHLKWLLTIMKTLVTYTPPFMKSLPKVVSLCRLKECLTKYNLGKGWNHPLVRLFSTCCDFMLTVKCLSSSLTSMQIWNQSPTNKWKTKGYIGNFVGTLRIVGNRLGRPISGKNFY